jgi:type II secretory pathway pseudopilin PulG
MKTAYKAGFTIIEAMLFLAISGLFVVGVIIATGNSIGTQRYRDSVVSLQTVLQRQFSDINNVDHSSSTWKCVVSGGVPVITNTGSTVASGVSDCVILGKYITSSDGKTITIKDVVGVTIYGSYSSDIAALVSSNIVISPMGVETYGLEWGTVLKNTSGTTYTFSMLMLRSPISGIIKTFVIPNVVVLDSNVKTTLLNSTYLANPLRACIKFDGSINSDKTAINITANASNSGAIELLGDATSGC